MTTMKEEQVECSLCGELSDQIIIGSTNSFGSPDLDTRPPEMERSTIYYRIQRCPSCGYCSSDLSKGSDNSHEIIESDEYQSIIRNKEIPEVAGPFLALSHQKQQMQQYSDSAWTAIQAAWICDDEGHHEAARKSREKAISMVENAKAHSQKIAHQAGASEAITIDLMRRASMFQQALELAEVTKINDGIEEVILQVINYEIALIELKDIDSHTIAEAQSAE